MDNERGYTLTEVLIVIFFIAILCGIGAALYAAAHFIAKFW